MNNQNDFSELRLERIRFPKKIIGVTVVLIIYSVTWRLANPNTFFWIGFVLMTVTAWVATYGWRQALYKLNNLLRRLETL